MAHPRPPAYAWDWFSRQRLLWREVRSRLAAGSGPTAARYRGVQDRIDVLPLLRTEYDTDPEVRAALDAVVAEVAFLGRTDGAFASLGVRSAPRGMRWWWTALTGETLDAPTRRPGPTDSGAHQLTLVDLAVVDPGPAMDDVAGGYGDRRG